MAISQTKQAQLTTPEAVYDQSFAPRSNGTNSGKSGLSAGAITGLAVGGVVACALSFVVGMQVGGSQNNGMNNQAGGPPGMSRTQNGQPGGPGGQMGSAPGTNQNQTGQNSQTSAAQSSNGAAQNNQAGSPSQTGSAQPPTTNTAPQAN